VEGPHGGRVGVQPHGARLQRRQALPRARTACFSLLTCLARPCDVRRWCTHAKLSVGLCLVVPYVLYCHRQDVAPGIPASVWQGRPQRACAHMSPASVPAGGRVRLRHQAQHPAAPGSLRLPPDRRASGLPRAEGPGDEPRRHLPVERAGARRFGCGRCQAGSASCQLGLAAVT